LFAIVFVRTRMASPYGHWTCILLIAATLDYCCTLAFAGGPGFTLY
jgi:hypothetical protein